jgi:hypothetical protein
MLNNISHSLPPFRGSVNFILAQLYSGVNTSPEELEIATYRYKLLGRALPEETVVPARTDASMAYKVSYG